MNKCYFAAILLTLFVSINAAADDYLLRLETVDLRDLPSGEQKPDLRTRESVEILVHAGKAFYGSTTNGTDKISVNGKLEVANDGIPRVRVHYRKTSDSGESVPGISGQRHPISNGIEFKTGVNSYELGNPVEFDASVSPSRRIRTIILIDNFDPSRNQD